MQIETEVFWWHSCCSLSKTLGDALQMLRAWDVRACWFHVSPPTTSLAKPSQEEGQPPAPSCDPAWRDRWRFPSPTPAWSSGAGQFLTTVHSSPPCHHHGRKPGCRGKHSTLGMHPTEVLCSATYLLSSQRPREESRRVSISPSLSTARALLKPMRRQGLQPKSRRFWVGGLLQNEKLGHAHKTSIESGATFQ